LIVPEFIQSLNVLVVLADTTQLEDRT